MCRPENSFYIIVLLLFSLLGAKNVNMEDEEWKNPHCVSSVLKMYLNELPTCVFTEEKYLSFVKTFKGKINFGLFLFEGDIYTKIISSNLIFIQNRGMFNVSISCFSFAEIELELSGLR